MTTLPHELLNTAMLGTLQRELSLHGLPLLDQIDPADREKRLLIAAAILSLKAQAGSPIPYDERPLPESAENEPPQTIHPNATRHLMMMLEGQNADMLGEWFSEVVRSGRRIPGELLPLLLDAGYRRQELPRRMKPALGERARWLVAQSHNTQWSWFSIPDPDAFWEKGNFETSLYVIEHYKTTVPQKALELIQSLWQSCDPDRKREILHACFYDVTLEYEPFLEVALDDPKIRDTVAHVLHHLPGSRFHHRMKDRLMSYVCFADNRLEFTLPDHLDDSAERDGHFVQWTQEEADGTQLHRKWLSQMLEVVCPATLREEWSLTSQELIAAAVTSEDPLLFLEAWTWAAYIAKDFEFARHLLPAIFDFDHDRDNYWNYYILIPNLPTELQETLFLDALNRPGTPFHPGVTSSWWQTFPWIPKSTTATNALIEKLHSYFQNVVPYDEQLGKDILRFARDIPISTRYDYLCVLDAAASRDENWREVYNNLRGLLDFRAEMLAAIHS